MLVMVTRINVVHTNSQPMLIISSTELVWVTLNLFRPITNVFVGSLHEDPWEDMGSWIHANSTLILVLTHINDLPH